MTGPNGFAGPIHFVDTAAFDGSAASPHAEARVDMTGGIRERAWPVLVEVA